MARSTRFASRLLSLIHCRKITDMAANMVMSPVAHIRPPAHDWSSRGLRPHDRLNARYQSSAISFVDPMMVTPRKAWNGMVRRNKMIRMG